MATTTEFSLVTCVSNAQIYSDCLLSSANKARGDFDIEFVPIINSGNLYSAATALNIGIDVSRSPYLVMAHQDVKLLGSWFATLRAVIAELPDDWAILGCAGIDLSYARADIGMWGGALRVRTVAVGSVWDSDDGLSLPPYWDGIKEVRPIHAADECLLVLNKSTGLRFDTLFTGFHFYGVDICLQARAAGYGVYGADLPIIHYGKYSASFQGETHYWPYLRFLHAKWKLQFPELLGTHMHWAEDELTSYIPLSLESDDGCSVQIRSLGLATLQLTNDADRGIV